MGGEDGPGSGGCCGSGARAGTTSASLFATPQVAHERRADGAMVLRSPRGLGAVPRSIGVLLERWAAAEPDRLFLAERAPAGGWRHLTYERGGAGRQCHRPGAARPPAGTRTGRS